MGAMKRTLKTFLLATLAGFSCFTPVDTGRATDIPVTGFVREETTVALDAKGSRLEFLKAKDGRLSWTLTWVDTATTHESLSMNTDGFFKGKGGSFISSHLPDLVFRRRPPFGPGPP